GHEVSPEDGHLRRHPAISAWVIPPEVLMGVDRQTVPSPKTISSGSSSQPCKPPSHFGGWYANLNPRHQGGPGGVAHSSFGEAKASAREACGSGQKMDNG